MRSINNGFYDDQLSVPQRQGVIISIPKDDRPKQCIKKMATDIFVYIYCLWLNTSYKIASACIAGRLRTVLPIVIHEDQKGFIKGRFIGDNIRMLFGVLV